MKNLWILLGLVACFGVYAEAKAEYSYDDYFNYDDLDDLDKILNEDFNDKQVYEKTDAENDLKVDDEIQKFREADEDKLVDLDDAKDYSDTLDGLQLEDNRSNDRSDDKKELLLDNINSSEGDSLSIVDDGKNIDDLVQNRLEPDDPNAPSRNEDYALLWGDDNIAPLPLPEEPENDENKAIYDETKQILQENNADDFEEEIKKAFETEIDRKPEEQPNQEQIIEETKQILAESDDSFVEENKNKETVDDKIDQVKNDIQNNIKSNNDKGDTVDKAYTDLNADLDKLFETLDKLKQDVTDNSSIDNNKNSAEKPKEDTEPETLDEKQDEDLKNLFEDNKFENDNVEDSEEIIKNNGDDNTVDLDKLLENILAEDDFSAEDSAAEILAPFVNDALNKPNPDDAMETDVETFDKKHPVLYLNDALVNDEKENSETLENTNDENDKDENTDDASVEKEVDVTTVLVDDLSSSERQELVSQFSVLHSDDLDVHSENFEKNVAPVHITLKLDEPTEITSPNYPNPYPTNNIVDWIIEGPGVGIELNITEFAVNGGLGDYLLIKPGGIDDSGHDGLLFTYRLNSERRYRFTDVDRLFMRFESKVGMMFFRGFVISAKMIAPLTSEQEVIPEPEPVVTPPHSTATITLAVRVPDFADLEEDFRILLADMATQYISDNDVDPGVNATSEVTSITHVGLCPVTWPNYEECSTVTFAVTLVYEDEGHDPRLDQDDLTAMWIVYSKRDPFALRLRAMGIHEFNGPDDGVMMSWLLIAGGVLITMMAVAFVLWRYSCFEDYTRMKAYSDTDSLHNEKRNMDLYPTPHQTLPPLYAEHEYKWPEEDATRVDMGGFSNRSYTRDNMYDFDSDEDVIASRDRQGVATAKGFSNV